MVRGRFVHARLLAASLAVVSLTATACSSKADAPKQEPPPPPVDAGVVDAITELGGTDPDKFLDPDPTRRVPTKKPKVRASRPIDIMLKSSPTGATAYVDGVEIGPTPTFWFGESDGLNHEFTFVLRGHGVGRYKFVPVQSGTVHATLDAVLDGSEKPGVPKPSSSTSASSPEPVRPPDTVLVPTHGNGSGAHGNATPGSNAPGSNAPGSNAPGSNAPGSNAPGSTPDPVGSGGSKFGPQP